MSSCTSVNSGTSTQLNDLVMPSADTSSSRTVTCDMDGDARDLCLIMPLCSAVPRDYPQPDVTGVGGSTSLWQCSIWSPGSTGSMVPSLMLPCSSFLLCHVSFCSCRDSPTHYRTITTAKFLPNGLELLLSKWAYLWFTPLTHTHLYWGRATGPWSHSSWSCYSLHKVLSLFSAVSKIVLHFLSQNSSVAAYASERSIEYSETTFGLKRAEESWVWECIRWEILHLLTFFFSSLVFHFQESVVALFLFWDF